MGPLLLSGYRWVIRGYNTLDDFVNNTNCLYKVRDCPKHNPGKYVYILSKVFLDGYVENKYWDKVENSRQFDNVTFIYEDHEESINLDYRWFEVMRKKKRGIYILDQTPKCYNGVPDTSTSPILVPGYFVLYDKYQGRPFSRYGFTDPHSIYRRFPNTERDIDISYNASCRKQRDRYMNLILAAAHKLGLSYYIETGKTSEEKYIDILRRSKIAYNFIGIGYRTGREFECMINGSLLINDDRTVDNMMTPGMEVNKDFIRFDPENVTKQMKYWIDNDEKRRSIAESGFRAMWKIWDGCHDPYMASRKLAAKYIKEKGW